MKAKQSQIRWCTEYFKLLFLLTTVFVYSGCKENCQDQDCPTKCSYKYINITKDGLNIFKDQPERYPIQEVKINPLSEPEAPILLAIVDTDDVKSMRFIICANTIYEIHLNESEVLNVSASFETASLDPCCDYYILESVFGNDGIYCNTPKQCESSINIELKN